MNNTTRLKFLILPFAVLLMLTASAFAENQSVKPARPKIGLVLEGGGALGFAHVGLLRVLEANRIPVDYVAGTSIGSIVAAAYASGLSVDEMEKALTETNWDGLFGEQEERQNKVYRLKAGRNREIYGDAKLGFKDGKFASPMGAISGQNVLPLFQKLFGNYPTEVDFDSLPVPFRAVAADLETGQAFVPSRGDLANVVRASMSVPGAFTPVEIDGRILVDGGIVDNLPVDVVRGMGADVLIASQLNDELPKRDSLTSPLAITGQIVSLLLQQNSDLSVKKLSAKDVLVPIDLKGYTAGDFPKGKEIMDKGEFAALAVLNNLRKFSVSAEEYEAYQAKRLRQQPAPKLKLAFVRLVNESTVPDNRILEHVNLKAGDEFDVNSVEKSISDIHGMGYFTSARYDLVKDAGQTGLEIKTVGKAYLSRYLRLGFALDDNLDGDATYRLGGVFRDYGVTTKDSYAEYKAEIGKLPQLKAELYQPVAVDSHWFVNPIIGYGRSVIPFRSDGKVIAEYERAEGVISLLGGYDLETYGEFSLGVNRGFGDLDPNVGAQDLPTVDYEIGEAVATLDLDRLDQADFPTKGYLGKIKFTSSLDELGADNEYEDLRLNSVLPLTLGRTTLIMSGNMLNTFDKRPLANSASLGGFLDVSGFQAGQLAASDFYQGKLILFHRFSEVKSPVFNLGFFLGGSFEYTNVQNDSPNIRDLPSIISGSVFLGADTPVLPTYLGFGMNDDGEHAFYLLIGRTSQSSN